MIIINDLHVSAFRSAGATPASAAALRRYALDYFENMLNQADEHLVIQGDLYDTYSIPMSDLLRSYQILEAWLTKGHKLTLIPGNHDLSKDTSKLGSFQFLAGLLEGHQQVQYIQGAGWVADNVYAISHVTNQDEMDMLLERVPECRYLLLHTNYNNFHAQGSDHSLDVSEQQAKDSKAGTLVFAHEHNHRIELQGRVFVLGNQFPSSVADCLSPQDKYMHRLTADGVERIRTWSREGSYQELDWKNPEPSEAQFIRFTGTATSEEAAAVVDTIARYRKTSTAFVVSNAVHIGENSAMDEFTVTSLEQARSFDVMGALKKFLTDEEYTILENLSNA